MYVFEVLVCGKANYNYFDTCANQWIYFAVTLEMDCKCAMFLIRKNNNKQKYFRLIYRVNNEKHFELIIG